MATACVVGLVFTYASLLGSLGVALCYERRLHCKSKSPPDDGSHGNIYSRNQRGERQLRDMKNYAPLNQTEKLRYTKH